MKKLFTFALLAVMTLTAAAQQVTFSVKGTAPADVKKVKVTDKLSGKTLVSATVKKGQIDMSGVADKDALLAIDDDSRWQTLFFNDGTPVTVNLETHQLKGSPLNSRLTAVDLASAEKMEALSKLAAEFGKMTPEEQQEKRDVFMEKYRAVVREMDDYFRKIAEENRDNLIPAAFADTYTQLYDEDVIDTLFNTRYVYANHPYAKKTIQQFKKKEQAMRAAEEARSAIIGKRFIDLEMPDTKGRTHRLSEYAGNGKWVLIDFWASWCGPCRQEMPNVTAAYKKYHDKGFDIVGLSFDNKKKAWTEAIGELDMPWINLSDLKGWKSVASETYHITSIPANFLVDPKGIIVARDLREEALGEKLKEIFGE